MIHDGWKQFPIYGREDGSFVVMHNGLSYHVPNEGEWVDLYAEVLKFVTENNIELQEEPKPEEPEVDIEAMVLAKRERLLKETDYLVLPDYPLEEDKLEEIKVYRQALRDITLQEGYFENVIWPTKPNWLK